MQPRFRPGDLVRVRGGEGNVYGVEQVGDMGDVQTVGVRFYAQDEDGEKYSYLRWFPAYNVRKA